MLYKFDHECFRKMINGQGDVRKHSFVNIITLKILMFQKEVINKKKKNLIMYKKVLNTFCRKVDDSRDIE